MKLRLVVLTVITSLVVTGTALAKHKDSNLPPHFNGWVCIHKSEGAWNANTGNGYYGGLQMTYNWMGMIPGRASDLPPIAQLWAAELKSAQYGFSWSWMHGQWPNTYPPCSSYFTH